MTTKNYYNVDWLQKAEETASPLWKEAIYALIDPPTRWLARSRVSGGFAGSMPPGSRFRTERGLSLQARRRHALAGLDVSHATILVQGTGTGWDILSWARLRPKKVIGVDLFGFESWPGVKKHCEDRYGVEVEFFESPLESCDFLGDGTVDLAASDAVFEHCKDLDAVMAETRRVLKPGRFVYAAYGPLWNCAGGDHFSGKDGLASSYNHIAISPEEYRRYFDANRGNTENFQDGGRYVELDLFSKLDTNQYLGIYAKNGFGIESLSMEISRRALEFRKTYPDRFAALVKRHPGLHPDHFLVKSNIIKLRKLEK